MEKELDYFHIGESYGGNQDWFTDRWMNIGGCAALTACDCCISMEKSGLKQGLYPYDVNALSREDYLDFGMLMKPYLRPRWGGIDRLDIFTKGLTAYLRDVGNSSLHMEPFADSASPEAAFELVKRQIEGGYPIPFLLLRHDDPRFSQLLWHWFTVVGFDSRETPTIRIATYGEPQDLPFAPLWQSGFKNNGGMVALS